MEPTAVPAEPAVEAPAAPAEAQDFPNEGFRFALRCETSKNVDFPQKRYYWKPYG